jgi:hypothetical protein
MAPIVERWVPISEDLDDRTIPPGTCIVWAGPTGDGTRWQTDRDAPLSGRGIVWTSETGAVCTAPGEVTRWWPAQACWMMREDDALAQGWAYPPPEQPDSDGDGVPDDQDPDPSDPDVQ